MGARVRVLLLFLIFLACGQQSIAQPLRPPGYFEAERSFKALSASDRVFLQVMLIANDNWQAVPNFDYSTRLYQAISRFQIGAGFVGDGVLTPAQIRHLIDNVAPWFRRWGFREVYLKGLPLHIPRGILTNEFQTRWGPEYSEPNGPMKLSYNYIESNLPNLFGRLLALDNQTVDYKVIRKDFFVIVNNFSNGERSYVRFHNHENGVIGFVFHWDPNIRGADRLPNIISSSLYVRKNYNAALPLPSVSNDVVASAPPQRQLTPESARPTPAPAGPDLPKSGDSSSGTGFFISTQGQIVTNAHVVEACRNIAVSKNSEAPIPARLVAADQQNDLAILSAQTLPAKILNIRIAPVRLGEPVVAFGFPLSTILSRNGNFTLGNVTALAGLNDDSRNLQVSVPVQPGNSGGPLLDYNGDVAGVVSAKLDTIKVASRIGDVVQNVNFAIKANAMVSFLDANRISYSTNVGSPMQIVDLAEQARLASVFIRCEK